MGFLEGDIFELAKSVDGGDGGAGGRESFAEGSFDYVFSRFLMGGITDWEAYIKLCLKLAKPGVRCLPFSYFLLHLPTLFAPI